MTKVVKGSNYYLLFTLYTEYTLEKFFTIWLCTPKYKNYRWCFHLFP